MRGCGAGHAHYCNHIVPPAASTIPTPRPNLAPSGGSNVLATSGSALASSSSSSGGNGGGGGGGGGGGSSKGRLVAKKRDLSVRSLDEP